MARQNIRVDFGLFAHNEAEGIAAMVGELARQTIFVRSDIDVRILILANGCSDKTAEIARASVPEALAAQIEVFDFEQGGKSRTVHRFIHETSRPDLDFLGFMDADIRLPNADTLARMVDAMQTRPELSAFSSRPVKDVEHDNLSVGPIAKLIVAGGGGLNDWRKAICGQLYLLRAPVARDIGLPLGLPVEDGFMRAMVLTDLFSRDGDTTCIDGDPEIFHVYESIRGLRELIHHQTRIVLGSAVNATLYRRFRRETPDRESLHALLMGEAQEDGWLPKVLEQDLPTRPFGYVPFGFLTKRIKAFRARGRAGIKGYVILCAGVVLDTLVWCLASWRMWRGQGSGFW